MGVRCFLSDSSFVDGKGAVSIRFFHRILLVPAVFHAVCSANNDKRASRWLEDWNSRGIVSETVREHERSMLFFVDRVLNGGFFFPRNRVQRCCTEQGCTVSE